MSIRNDIKNRFLKLFSIEIITKGCGFLFLPVYLSLMTQSEYGSYSYIMSIVGMLAFIFGVGQHVTLSRFYHSKEYSRDALIETIHLILFISFILFGGMLLLFKTQFINLFFKFDVANSVYYAMIVLAMFFSANQVFMMFLYQSEQIKIIQKKKLFEFLTVNILAIMMLYYLEYPKDALRIFAVVFAQVITFYLFYKHFFKISSMRLKNKSKNLFVRSMKNGFPIAIGSFANFFILFGDRYVIEKLLDKSLLGIYSFVLVIAGILMLVFQVFQGIWFPYFFKEKNLDISLQRVRKIILGFIPVSLIAYFLMYSLIYCLSSTFIEASYGKSLEFLWILVIAFFFQIAGMSIAGFYQIFEKNHVCVVINIIISLLNIILNFYLIKRYGLSGAAISTLIVSFILFVLHFALVHYYKRQGVYGEYFSNH